MQRIQIQSMQLVRAEGPTAECGPAKITSTGSEAMRDAQLQLRRWAHTAPAKGGYDKCDFTLVFEDGTRYKGRYDLKHESIEAVDLPGHMRSHLEYYSGRYCPAWLKAERGGEQRYQRSVQDIPEDERNRCLAFIAYYEFGQGEVILPDELLLLAETPRHTVRMFSDGALEVATRPQGVPALKVGPDKAAQLFAELLDDPAEGETLEMALEPRCDAVLQSVSSPPPAIQEGTRVLHDALGYGTVLQGGDSDVLVRFDDPVGPDCYVAQVFADRLTLDDN